MKEIKKEDVLDLSYKDITFLILEKEKKGMNTLDLFTKIVTLLELPTSTIENKIADYYTSLATDKRFILVDGIWDLRKRHTSDKIIVDETLEDDEETDLDEGHEDMDTFDDEDDDLSDLVVLDEEDLNE